MSESRRCFKAHDYRKEPAKAPYRGQGLPKGTDGNSFLSQSRQDFSREAIEGAVPYKRVQKARHRTDEAHGGAADGSPLRGTIQA